MHTCGDSISNSTIIKTLIPAHAHAHASTRIQSHKQSLLSCLSSISNPWACRVFELALHGDLDSAPYSVLQPARNVVLQRCGSQHLESPTTAFRVSKTAVAQIMVLNMLSPRVRLQGELEDIRRYMMYCRGMKHNSSELQRRFWVENLNISECVFVCVHACMCVCMCTCVQVA